METKMKMKKIKIRIKKELVSLVLIVLAVTTATTVFGVIYYHGETWFPVMRDILTSGNTSPEISAADTSDTENFTYRITIEELKKNEKTESSDLLLLVNASHPLPETFKPELTEYNGAIMHPKMKEPYILLRDETQAETETRIYVSGHYRTPEEQQQIINNSEDGIAAKVGCSEHEAGLALDVYAPFFAGEQFLRSPAGRRVNTLCGEYGFIIRYPKDSKDITGIAYEPWHLRYVGLPHSKLIMDSGITYEEYLDFLTPETWFTASDDDNCFILRTSSDNVSLPREWSRCTISPDNTGYNIITLWVTE